MEAALNQILIWFSGVFRILNDTVFTAWGFHVSYFWILLGLTFMGFLFSVLLPFAGREGSSAYSTYANSERIKDRKYLKSHRD